MQAVEQSLAIVDRAQRVGEEDYVERSRQRRDDSRALDITDDEGQVRIDPARFVDHRAATIDAHAERRLEFRQQVADPAPELEHPGALGDQELEVEQIFPMKETGAFASLRQRQVVLFRKLVSTFGDHAVAPLAVKQDILPKLIHDRYSQIAFTLRDEVIRAARSASELRHGPYWRGPLPLRLAPALAAITTERPVTAPPKVPAG